MTKQTSIPIDDEDELFAAALGPNHPPPARPPDDAVAKVGSYTVPARFENLPVVKQLDQIDFDALFWIAIAQTGAGKSMILPCIEALIRKSQGRKVRIYFRQPTRVAVQFLYSGLKKFWEPFGLTFGIMTRDKKEGLENDIIVYSDGSLKSVLTKGDDVEKIVYFDEIHNVGTVATEIEIAICKKMKVPMRLLSATIDPKVFLEYLGPETKLYHLDGRTFPIQKKLVHLPKEHFWREVNDVAFFEFMDRCVEEVATENERALFFVPTKAMAHELVEKYHDKIATTFCHGEVNPADLEKWVDDHANEPFIIFCTLVAATSITLDVGKVFIWDERIDGEVREGIQRQYATRPDNNLVLQMAGRAGRIRSGSALLISTVGEEASAWAKQRVWDEVVPVPPVMPCAKTTPYNVLLALAAHGVTTDDQIDLLTKLDENEIAHARRWLINHGCLTKTGELTRLGEWVDRMPLDVPLAHMVLTAPSDEARLALAAAVACSLKGSYQMVYLKPDSRQLQSARFERLNKWRTDEQARVRGKYDEQGLPLAPNAPPRPEELLPLLPRELVIPDSMPMTFALILQRAYQARDRNNKGDSLPSFCNRSNLSMRMMNLIMRDFEEILKHIGTGALLSFKTMDLTRARLIEEVSYHMMSHDTLARVDWVGGKTWPKWRGYGCTLDSVSKELFGIVDGMTFSAWGLPKVIRAKSGNQFVSLDFATIRRGRNQ